MEHDTTCAIYDNDIFERHCTCGADLVPPRVVGFEVIINGVSVLDKVGVNSRDFESYELVRRSEAEAWTAARIAGDAATSSPLRARNGRGRYDAHRCPRHRPGPMPWTPAPRSPTAI